MLNRNSKFKEKSWKSYEMENNQNTEQSYLQISVDDLNSHVIPYFDTSGNGKISQEEFLHKIDFTSRNDRVNELLHKLRQIREDLQLQNPEHSPRTANEELFHKFDDNGSGNITMSELKEGLVQLGIVYSNFEVRGKKYRFADVSLYLLPSNNPLRITLVNLVLSDQFEWSVMLLIVSNSIILALEDFSDKGRYPDEDGNTNPNLLNQVNQKSDSLFTCMFAIESFLKILAFGFVQDEGSYLRDGWNCLDLSVVIFGILSLPFLEIVGLSSLRVFRVVRPLRTISAMPSLRNIVESLIASIPTMLNVLLLILMLIIFFAIFALQLWNGRQKYHCHNTEFPVGDQWPTAPDSRSCSDTAGLYDCPANFPYCETDLQNFHNSSYVPNTWLPESMNWGITNFDNIGYAMLSVFQCITMENWVFIMYIMQDCSNQVMVSLFFWLLVVMGGLFMINLMFAVMWEKYLSVTDSPEEKSAKGTGKGTRFNTSASQNTLPGASSTHETDRTPPPTTSERPIIPLKSSTVHPVHMKANPSFRDRVAVMVKSEQGSNFQYFMLFCIVLNTVVLAMERYPNNPAEDKITEIMNTILTLIFLLEMVINLYGLGCREYWTSPLFAFDGLVVAITCVELLLQYLGVEVVSGAISALRFFRLCRLIKLVKGMKTLYNLLVQIVQSLMQVANIVFVLFLFLYIFSLMGMQFFAYQLQFDVDGNYVEYDPYDMIDDYWTPRTNFNNLFGSFLAVFQVVTGEDYNQIMYDVIRAKGYWSSFYFIFCLMLGNIIVLNLFLAILLSNFDLASRDQTTEKVARIRRKIEIKQRMELLKHKAKAWSKSTYVNSRRGSRRPSFNSGEKLIPFMTTSGKGSAGSISSWRNLKVWRRGSFERNEVMDRSSLDSPEPKDLSVVEEKSYEKEHEDSQCRLKETDQPLITRPQTARYPHPFGKPQSYAHGSPSRSTSLDSANFSAIRKGLVSEFQSCSRDHSSQTHLPITSKSVTEKSMQQALENASLVDDLPKSAGVEVASEGRSRAQTAGSDPNDMECSRPLLASRSDDGQIASSLSSAKFPVLAKDGTNQTNSTIFESSCAQWPKIMVDSVGTEEKGNCGQTAREGATGPLAWICYCCGCWLSRKGKTHGTVAPLSSGTCEGLPAQSQKSMGCLGESADFYDQGESKCEVQSSGIHRLETVSGDLIVLSHEKLQQLEQSSEGLQRDSKGRVHLTGAQRLLLMGQSNSSNQSNSPVSRRCPTPSVRRSFPKKLHNLAYKLVQRDELDYAVLFLILFSSLMLAVNSPLTNPTSSKATFVHYVDWAVTVIFSLEMLLKVFALGFRGYFCGKEWGWNAMDFVIVVINLVSTSMNKESSLTSIRALRALRALRPLRLIQRNPGLKQVVNTMVVAIPSLSNVVIVLFFFFLIFGIIGTSTFKGSFYECDFSCLSENDFESISSEYGFSRQSYKKTFTMQDCLDLGCTWKQTIDQNFDQLFRSMMTLFEMATLENWVNIMHAGMNAVGVEMHPVEGYAKARSIYFVFFIIVGNFFAMNLFVGAVIENYQKQKREDSTGLMTDTQRQWIEAQMLMSRAELKAKLKAPKNLFRARVYKIVEPQKFDNFVLFLIILNALVMMLKHAREPPYITSLVLVANTTFTFVFLVELLLKLIAFGPRWPMKSGWNMFDTIVVLFAFISFMVAYFKGGEAVGISAVATTARVARVLLLFRLIRRAQTMRQLSDVVIQELPSIINVSALLFLVLFIYTIIGVNLFASVHLQTSLTEHANFQDFWRAFLTLFRCATGEGWNNLMYELMLKPDGTGEYLPLGTSCKPNPSYYDLQAAWEHTGDRTYMIGCGSPAYVTYPYFITFMLLTSLIMINLFVAIIVDSVGDTAKRNESPLPPHQFREFCKYWSEFDEEATYKISIKDLFLLIEKVPHPLGLGGLQPTETQVRRFIYELRLDNFSRHVSFYNVCTAMGERLILEHAIITKSDCELGFLLNSRRAHEAKSYFHEAKDDISDLPLSPQDAQLVNHQMKLWGSKKVRKIHEKLPERSIDNAAEFLAANVLQKAVKRFIFHRRHVKKTQEGVLLPSLAESKENVDNSMDKKPLTDPTRFKADDDDSFSSLDPSSNRALHESSLRDPNASDAETISSPCSVPQNGVLADGVTLSDIVRPNKHFSSEGEGNCSEDLIKSKNSQQKKTRRQQKNVIPVSDRCEM